MTIDSTSPMSDSPQEPRDKRDMTEDQERIAERVAKILRLAARNSNEAEAAAATAKAQEMLAAYNLDLATVEKAAAGGGSGKREDAAVSGGQYVYQRELWRAVARLNFCLYFSTEKKVQRSARTRLSDGTMIDRPRYFYQRQHRLVGRVVNTTASRTMAQYLEQTIERICRERYPQQSQFFSKSAVSFREGAADELVWRLKKERDKMLKEERERLDRERAERQARMGGVASDTALVTLGAYIDEETDRNNDFLYGEGWSAEQARQRSQAAAEAAEEERRYAEWAAAHPKEAAAEEKRRRAEAEKTERYWRNRGPGSRGGSVGKNRDWQAYSAGSRAGEKISLNRQADHGAAGAKRLS